MIRMKKLMFTRESECVQPIRELICMQNHRTLVLWCLDCAPRYATMYKNAFPTDGRLDTLLKVTESWSRGEIKMPTAKKYILDAHRAATEAEGFPSAQAAARAVAHAASSIHVETHAIGMVLYGLTAVWHSADEKGRDSAITKECLWLRNRLAYWAQEEPQMDGDWATFLLRDGPNKELLLDTKKRETWTTGA